MSTARPDGQSFLSLEGLHVFVTGAAGGIGGAAVREFLSHGCLVTALDRRAIDRPTLAPGPEQKSRLHCVRGDLTSESSIFAAFESANKTFGPPSILIANAGITDESAHPPIWEIETETWDRVNTTNVRGTFLTIKHFLRSVKNYQEEEGSELENVAIVLTGSETGKFGQEGHAEYASGKAGLQYGLVRGVKNEIVRLNSKARINAVAPGWVDTPLIGDRLDDPKEMWAECQATVALKKIAQPEDVARTMAFLSSHHAAGHISGECLSVDGGQEGRLIWKEHQVLGPNETASSSMGPLKSATSGPPTSVLTTRPSIPAPLSSPKSSRRLRITISIDFDAISGYLGTGHTPENTLADYSAGLFSARVGVPRLLSLLAKHKISNAVTWFIPGHSMETFPEETRSIVSSGAEIGLHGYSHEGAYAMTPEQEAHVLEKCISLATALQNGKSPRGYRAPLYQIRESTVSLLQSHNFLYDSSMNAHDSLPYLLPHPFPSAPPDVPDYTQPAHTWMHPTQLSEPTPSPSPTESRTNDTTTKPTPLVEIPASWYTEDMTPLGYYPYTASTQGYVAVDVVEKMWWDRFDWLWENESSSPYGSIYPLVLHPESAGRAHIVGMVDRFLGKCVRRAAEAGEGEITFETMETAAAAWKVVEGLGT